MHHFKSSTSMFSGNLFITFICWFVAVYKKFRREKLRHRINSDHNTRRNLYLREHQKFAKKFVLNLVIFLPFCLKAASQWNTSILLKMPPSQPLPPKENALFKRILVSHSSDSNIFAKFQTFAILILMTCDFCLPAKSM